MNKLTTTLLAVLVCLSASAQQKIVINPDSRHQTIEFFGAADAWSGNFVGKYWAPERKREIADWLFSQEYDASGNPVGIGLTIWRVNLGAGTLEQRDADIYPYQRRAESYMKVDGKGYDWGKCAGHEYFMQAAKERGCNQFILFSNSPLVQYTKNGKGYAPTDNSANLREDCYDDYAKYLADVTEHLMDKGFNIPYISPVNEPQGDWDTPRQEGSPWRNSEVFCLTKALDSVLCRSARLDSVRIFLGEANRMKMIYTNRPKMFARFGSDSVECPGRQLFHFFDPESPHFTGSLKHVEKEFTAHPYHDHFTSKDLREVHRLAGEEFRKYGVDYHSSEWCLLPTSKQYQGITADWAKGNHADMQAALMMARIMYSDFVDTDAVSWCYWKGMELKGDHALISLHAKDGDIHKGGHATANKLLWTLGNFSSFVLPGYARVAVEGADDLDTLAATAFISPKSDRIVAVLINSSFEDIEVDLALPKSIKKKISSVTSYRTDARHDLAKTLTGQGCSHVAGARGVTTIVFELKN